MQRLQCEVTEIERVGRREAEADGLRMDLAVKVVGAGPKGCRLPDGVKGRETRISRTVLFERQIARGQQVLLTPEESAVVVAAKPPAEAADGWTEGDFDGDGFAEHRLRNRFVQVDVAPAFGGRIASLKLRRRGIEQMVRTLLPSLGAARFGGYVDRLAGGDPDDGSEYHLADASADEVIVTRELRKPVAGELTRGLRLLDGTPLALLTVTIRRRWDDDEAKKLREREEKRRKGEPDEEPEPKDPEVRYGAQLRLAPGGRPEGEAELLLRVPDGLRRQRWDRYSWFDARPASPGSAAVYHHAVRAGLVLLHDPAALESIGADAFEDPDSVTLELGWPSVPLKLGRQVTHTGALLPVDALAARADCLACASLGLPGPAGTPLFLAIRGPAEAEAEVRCGGVRLRPEPRLVDLRGVGRLLVATLELPGCGSPGAADLLVGGERMELRWDG